MKSNVKINLTISFTNNFLKNILGFTQPHFYLLDDINGFYQLIARSYKSNKPIIITGIEKIN